MSPTSPAAWPTDLSPEDAFEQAWQRHYQEGGEVPRLADFLPSPNDPDYVQLTVHLIEIDLERRWCAERFQKKARGLAETSAGDEQRSTDRPIVKPRAVADYLQTLNWNCDSEWLPDLLAAEYEAQRRAGQIVSVTEYLDQYAKIRESLRERFAAIDEELRQEQREAVQRSGEAFPEIPGFAIERVLGRGGMSVVYLAYDLALHRQVAIKLLTQAPKTAAELARLELEPAVQAQFRHSSVVRIHGKGTFDGRPFLVCEYVNGQSLREAIKTATLAPQRAAEIVAHIARTMHDVHDAGILHRDLKPENILLDQAGTPLVADFGIAKVTPDHVWAQNIAGQGQAELTIQGEVMGTPGYMAPEQAAGDVGHERTIDVYGLGGILYAVLTGRPPFFAATRDEIMHSVRTEEPVEPRRLNPHVPRDLNTICLKCLAKNPQRRYATAKQVAEDLERFVKGEPIHARAVSSFERVVRWCARNRAVASLIAAVVLLLVTGTTVSSILANSAIKSRDRLDTQLHTAHTSRAHQMIQQANIGGALRLLESMWKPNSRAARGFDWDYALRQCHSERFALTGHAAEISALAVTRDGQTVASAGADGELRIVSTATGDLLKSARLNLPISHLVFNHDGTRLAVATRDGGVSIWKIAAGDCHELIRYEAHLMPVRCLAFHPSANLVASVSDEAGVHVWDADSGQVQLRQTDELASIISNISFAPDGQSVWAFVGHWDMPEEAGLWQLDLETEQFQQLTLELAVPEPENPATIREAVLRGDGKWLYVVGSDHRVRGFQFGDLGIELKWTLPQSRSAKRLVVTNAWVGLYDPHSKSLTIHDPEYGRHLRTIRGHVERLVAAAASQDGSVVALAARDRLIKIWNGNEETDGLTLRGHEAWIKHIVLSPDGQTLASGGNDQGVHLWDLETGVRLHRLGKHEVKNEPTSDGSPGALRIVSTYFGHQAFVSGIAFSPDSSQVLSLAEGEDQRLLVWDVETGKLLQEIPTLVAQPRGLVAHPVRTEVAFYSMHGTVYFFDWQQGKKTGELQIPQVTQKALAYARDGSLLATGGSDGQVRLWRDETREPIATLVGLTNDVQRIVFNRAGTLLAAGDAQGSIRVWELPQSKPKYAIEGFGDQLTGLNFTPDNRLLTASGRAGTGTMEIWDLPLNQEVMSLTGEYQHCLMTPDGTRIVASTGGMLTIRVLDSRPVDGQRYRREPLVVQAPPEAAKTLLGTPPPLRAVGYFAADSIPFIDGEVKRTGVKWISPRQTGNRYVAVKLIMPAALEMATAEEFRENYQEWDPDGTQPIERSRASWQSPKQFKLQTADGQEFTGKFHGSMPFVMPNLGFRDGIATGRYFAAPQPLQRTIYVVVFETPADCNLTDMQIQMRSDPPIAVPNEPFPAPQRRSPRAPAENEIPGPEL